MRRSERSPGRVAPAVSSSGIIKQENADYTYDSPGEISSSGRMSFTGETITVLHVDDDPDYGEMIRAFLEREDDRIEVVTETSASDGLDRFTDDDPDIDCLVSDYEMPETNGLDLLACVRETDPELPFILLTGKGNEEIASEAISSGVTDYFQKRPETEQYELLANRVVNAVEQKRATRTAERTRQRLREIAANTNDIFWVFNDDWSELLFANDAYEDIMGQPLEVIRNQPLRFLEAIHPDDRGRATEHMERLSAGDPVDLELRVNADEDYQRWIWVQAEPIFDDGGDIVRLVGFTRDITELRRYSNTLQELHRATRDLVEAKTKQDIADLMVEAAREILDMTVNGSWLYDETATALRPVGWTDEADDILGGLPTYYEGEGIAWGAFEAGEVEVFDDVSNHPDRYNDETPMASEIILPLGEHGIMIFGATEPETFDETDVALAEILVANAEAALGRVERESDLERKNERLDEFASIVSHDLRNPLNVAEGRLDLARQECDSEHLDHVGRAHERMETLIEDVLSWSREGETVADTEAVDLAAISEACWRNTDTANATLVTDANRVIRADRTRLKQLLENLFRNAVEHGSTNPRSEAREDAVEHGGTDVVVTVGELDDVSSSGASGGSEDEQSESSGGFYVADDGPGIPDADRKQIFEAGYSTTHEGTGFGLSIVEQIADAHGWGVTATTDGGAKFEITGVKSADGQS